MKSLLICLLASLLLVVVAGIPQAPSAPSTDEHIADVEEDLDDSDDTTGFNLTKILQAAYSYKSVLRSFNVITVWVCNFWVKGNWHKSCF